MPRKLSNGVNTSGTSTGSIGATGTSLAPVITDGDLTLLTTGAGNVTTPDIMFIDDTTSSTSTTTGSVITDGGMSVSGDVYIGGTINTGGAAGINNTPIGITTPNTGAFTNLTVGGLTTLAEGSDVTLAKTGATGVVAHDFNTGRIWYHSGIAANFTMNLTNVPTTDGRQIEVSVYLSQSATPYYVSAFQIDGVAQTIRWSGYAPPTPRAYTVEIQTFTLLRAGGTWLVLSTTTSAGLPDGSSVERAAPSASVIKTLTGTTTNGFYWINPGGLGAILLWCDMNYSGGGWHLVMCNIKSGLDGRAPLQNGIGELTYSQAVNDNNFNGTVNSSLYFRQMVGARFWPSLGLTVTQFCSTAPVSLNATASHTKRYQWTYTGMGATYGFTTVAGVGADGSGAGAPGFQTYHAANGYGLTTWDVDNDAAGGNCSTSYGNTPFWYGACWDGNMWGGGNSGGHQDAPFWSGSTTDYHNYMAVYLK